VIWLSSSLVVVQIRRDECLCGQRARHLAHEAAIDLEPVQVIEVGLTVLANRRDWPRRSVQQSQVVGDVAGASAELPAQRRYEERNVQDVHLVGQDVLLEAPREQHDRVEGERAADQCGHDGIKGKTDTGQSRRR
jgi:hypothetical protein